MFTNIQSGKGDRPQRGLATFLLADRREASNPNQSKVAAKETGTSRDVAVDESR